MPTTDSISLRLAARLKQYTRQAWTNRWPLVLVWGWFIGLLGLYAIVLLIIPLLGPFSVTTKLDVVLPETADLTPAQFKSELQIHGFEQVKVEPNEPNGAEHSLVLVITETRSPWSNERVLDSLIPILEEMSVERGSLSINFEPPAKKKLTPAATFPLAMIIGAFLLWQQRSGTYIKPTPQRNLRLEHFILAALSSLPLALVLLMAFSASGDHDGLGSDPIEAQWQSVLAIAVLIPFIEEAIFRAWLLEASSRLMHPALALALSAVVFSAIHPLGFAENTIFLLPGLLWGYLWLRYRSLALCTLAHSSYNLLALAIMAKLS